MSEYMRRAVRSVAVSALTLFALAVAYAVVEVVRLLWLLLAGL